MAAAQSKRLVLTAAGLFVAVGLTAASASPQGMRPAALEAEVQLMTAGPGTLTIAPAGGGRESATCEVDAQEYQVADEDCVHLFDEGQTVTLTAEPKPGHSFVGWSDFKCSRNSTSCTMTLAPGPRYVAARFSPVNLRIFQGGFGRVTVTPSPLRACSFDFSSPCEFKAGTVVTLRRERAAPGLFWIGACDRNRSGRLDAPTCTLRLRSSEAIGAGYANPGEIPPVKGSGIEIRLAGKGRGKVKGAVVNGNKTLTCVGVNCSIKGLTRYDYVRLTVQALRGSRFDRWSDGPRLTTRVIGLSATNRLWAKFDKKR